METRCESFKCDGRNCDKRHPRECRFYNDYGRCKFGESCLYDHVDRSDPVLEELERVKAKLDVVEDLIVEKNLEIKILFEKLEFALSTIPKKEVKEKGDVTAEDEKEKSCEIKVVEDAGIDANGSGFGASNDKEEKSGGKRENKKKKKVKTDKNKGAGNCSEEKENDLVATIEGHSVLVLDNKAKIETLYEQSRRFGGLWYKCVVCSYARETRYINEVRDHIVSEHWDALNQVETGTREEVMAGREANFGIGLEQLAGRAQTVDTLENNLDKYLNPELSKVAHPRKELLDGPSDGWGGEE